MAWRDAHVTLIYGKRDGRAHICAAKPLTKLVRHVDADVRQRLGMDGPRTLLSCLISGAISTY